MAVGKITGQMLGDTLGNLDRDGVDLAFDTDLIYLDVINRRVGIKNTSPTRELDVLGTTRTTNLEVTNTLDVGNIRIQGNNIFSTTGILNLAPPSGSQVVYQNKLTIDDLQIEGNHIRTINSNANLDFTANGTGTINLNSDVEVNGNLHATGTITADGNLQLGNSDTDNIVFNGEIASDIVPDVDDLYKLGSPGKRWNDIWVNSITATTISGGGAVVDGVDLTLRQGNIYFVAVNGDDGNTGTHMQDPLSSVGRALDLATSGDTVYIFPGTYSETLPLIVPVGVTVKGAGIRSVTIQPDSDDTVDMFLLNGETTVEDLTITGFKFDSSTNTGYAFKFAPNITVTSRSPYIRNITVITQGSVTSVSDPRGFLTGDAGKGAFIDGSVANASSKEASMLFHSVTFICPGVDTITATNGVRVEWLNCFTYFADRGFYAYSGSSGFSGDGKTRIKITNTTGTFNVGNTLSYYDTDGTTLLASGTIESIDGDFYVIDGKSLGFETLQDREAKTVFVNGNAQASTAQFKYGTASLLLDGTSDYITITSQPDFEFGTGDFCFEAWVRPTATGTFRTLFDLRTTTGDLNGIIIGLSNVDALYFYYNGNYRIGPAGSVPINTWTHIALSRSSGSTKAWVNGTQVGSTYSDSNNYPERGVRVGADPNGNFAFTGYIDDIRISKGVPRYTSGFTAPAAALTGDNNSVLLLHFDSPNGSTILLDDGVTLQDIRTSAGGTATIIDFADYNDFGAEIRSIASASVYGNYGVYGDGIGVIGYFIGHNFGYVGAGKESNNDPSYYPDDSTNVNEVVEINDAKIYYTSVDHKGDFKVGDFFVVDQENGTVTFNATGVSISSSSGLTFTDGVDTTVIAPSYVQTGNIKISGNTIESITGGITLTAANSNITSTANITTTGSIVVDTTLAVGGNTTLGDSTADTVTYTARIASDITPSSNATYNLGSASNQWVNIYLANAQIDDISIAGNLIQTTVSNSDLELRANGTGSVVIDNLSFNNNSIISNTLDTDIILNPNGTGTIQLQKDTDITGNLSVTGNITLGGNIQIGDQASDTINLVGRVTNNIVPAVTATYNIGSTALRWANLFTDKLVIDDIVIDTNVIENTVSNADLELRANGTGSIVIDSLSFYNNEISSNSLDTDIVINPNGIGTIELQKDTNITGNLAVNGTSTFNGNTTFGDSSSDTIVFQSFIDSDLIPYQNSLYDLGTSSLKWNNFYASRLVIDDIVIDTNVIESVDSNANLELRANGTGSIQIDLLNFRDNEISSNTLDTDIIINPNGSGSIQLMKDTVISGSLTVTGSMSLTGNITLGDSFSDTVTFLAGIASDILPLTTNTYSLGSATYRWANGYFDKVVVDDIEIDTNVIQSTLSNQNLELRANGTGSIQIDTLNFKSNTISSNTTNADININPNGTGTIQLQKDTVVSGSLTVTGNYILNGNVTLGDSATDTINPLGRFINDILPATTSTYSLGTSSLRWLVGYFDKVVVDDIEIDTNVIQSTLSNQNLELRANGTGSVQVDLLNFKSNAITSNTTNTDIQINPNGTGIIQLLKDTNITGNLTVSGNIVLGGNITIGDQSSDTINLVGSITNNLIPSVNSTFDIGTSSLRWRNFYASKAVIDDIEIDTNVIQSTLSNQNLELRANGTGSVQIDTLNFKSNIISSNTLNADIIISPDTFGNIQLTTDTIVSGTLTVNGESVFYGNVTLGDASGDAINPIGRFISNLLPQTTNVYTIGNSSLRWAAGYFNKIIVDDIEIDTNVIQSTLSNQNLELRANGTGSVQVDLLNFKTNIISSNTTNTDININPNGTGTIQLLKDTSVTGNLSVSGNITLGGNITIGDQSSDTINLVGVVTNNLIPSTTSLYDIGTSALRWRSVFASKVVIDDIEIDTNVIQSTLSNQNLELRANGTGSVQIDTLNFKSNTISSNTTNADININPNGTGTIQLQKDTVVSGSLTVNGTYILTGNIQLGDSVSDTINPIGSFINNLVPLTTNTYSVGNYDFRWANGYFNKIVVDDIEIDTNVIQSMLSNQNLELRANGTGSVQIDILNFKSNIISSNTTNTDIEINPNGTGTIQLQKDTDITGNLTVSGNITLGGNIQIGDQTSDTINFVGSITNNLVPNVTGLFTLGTSSYRWNNIFLSNAQIDDIEINDNYIRTTNSNADLELSANGTGVVKVPSSNVGITQNLTVNGTSNLGNTTVTGTLTVDNLVLNASITAGAFYTGEIEIAGNVIRTINSNSDLELRANGTGAVLLENLSVQQSTISTVTAGQDIELTPSGSGIVKINSTQALQVPVGTDAQRPSAASGMIRFNSTANQYEGYNGSYWVQLGGISDVDRDTYITPELTPGANDNTIRFYNNGALSASLTSTEFNVNRLIVDDIQIDGNVVSTISTNADLELKPNGTGAVVIDGFRWTTNTLTNTNSGAVTTFQSTGTGYYYISGTNAVVIPAGANGDRPGSPVTGMVRFNTDLTLVEVFDGVSWTSVAGAGGGITLAQAEDIALAQALIFG